MKKHQPNSKSASVEKDEILPQYDFSDSRPNPYAARYSVGSAVIVLDPDVALMFPNAVEVNEALRALGGIIQKHRPRLAK